MSELLAAAGGKRVLLLNPPAAEMLETPDALGSAATPPFGLLRLATWLRARGAEVSLLDAASDPSLGGQRRSHVRKRVRCGDDGDPPVWRDVWHLGLDRAALERRLADFSPDLVAVSATFTWHAPAVAEAIAACRAVHPGARVVLGGNFATLCPEEARQTGADEVVAGDVPGATLLPTAIDLVPGPVREDWVRLVKGCPHRCSYCVTPVLNGGRVAIRSPEEVVAEIKEKAARHGVRRFAFHDDAVLYRRREHAERVLDLVVQERLGVTIEFATGIAATEVDEGLARRFADAGVDGVRLALETIDPARARAMHRPQARDQFVRAVEILRAHGYTGPRLRAFYLVGLPDQTIDDVLEAVLWLYGIGVTPHLTTYTLTPGSEDHARFRDRIAGLPVDELAPLAWRFAHPGMKVRDLDRCVGWFSQRYYAPGRILDSPTDDPLIVRMKAVARARGLAQAGRT